MGVVPLKASANPLAATGSAKTHHRMMSRPFSRRPWPSRRGCREHRATCALHLIECQSLPPANLLSVALRLARRRGRIGHIPLLPQGFPWSSVWHGGTTSSVPGVKVRHGHGCRDCRFRDRPRADVRQLAGRGPFQRVSLSNRCLGERLFMI